MRGQPAGWSRSSGDVVAPDAGSTVHQLIDERIGLTVHLVIDRIVEGLCAGGLRFAPDVSVERLGRLARLMTLKFAVMGLGIGGAKAGIAGRRRGTGIDPLLLRAGELLRPHLEAGFLMGEDLGTTGDDIVALYRRAGVDPIAVVRSHLLDRGVAPSVPSWVQLADLFSDQQVSRLAGAGVAESVMAGAAVLALPLDTLTVAIQGYGTVGMAAAHRLAEAGATIVAVAVERATLLDPGGLDVADLEGARDHLGRIDRSRLSRPVTVLSRDDWCRLPVQVLIPAAVEDAITSRHLSRLSRRVRLIVEAANAPVDPATEAVLEQAGVAVVPDFIANSGSAAGWGALASGRLQSPTEMLEEACARIAWATTQVLGSGLPGRTARERALALAAMAGDIQARNDSTSVPLPRS